MSSLLCALGIVGACCAGAQDVEVVVVEGTFTVASSPAEGRGAQQFCDKVENALADAGIGFTLATEKQVEEGVLGGHKVAIFPYSANWTDLETGKVAEWIRAGGKLIGFYTVPDEISQLLGVEGTGFRREEYDGQYAEMQFVEGRPPGFPQSVHQTSRNLMVREAGEGAQVIAEWRDKEGNATGAPAVILSENGLYMSHVLHTGNAEEQSLFVLASVAHFLPHIWQQAVEGSLVAVPRAAEVDSLEALAALAKGKPEAERLLGALHEALPKTRELLRGKDYQIALRTAKRAQTLARQVVAATYGSRDGEFRGAWHGGGTGKDWEAIMASLEEAGFNALLPLMCTGNHAYYPSEVLPQTGDRDELRLCLEAAKRHNIEVHVWRINWCMLGGSPERRQQFVDDGRTMVSVSGKLMTEDPATGSTVWMCPSHEGNREIEKRAMLELTRNYHPAGIHFDYMRFPSRDFCYCERCRAKFEDSAGFTVESWPADCFAGGKLFEQYKRFRKDLQTSLVREIAEESRRMDPDVKISLAARSALPGAPENDGQDWPTWCQEGYLDLVCPMDYSGHDDARLARWLEKQLDTLDGCVPLYAGLGVTYRDNSLATAVRAARQIKIARDAGADGFLVFSYNETLQRMMEGLKLGPTAQPTTMMPHHHPKVRLRVEMPRAPEGFPPRTWPEGAKVRARAQVIGPTGARRLTLRCDVQTTDGQVTQAGERTTVRGREWAAEVEGGGDAAGHYQWVATGEAVLGDGRERAFILRSRPWRIATEEEAEEYRRQASPPEFKTDGIRVGVLMDGYGSQALLAALGKAPGIEAHPLYQGSEDHLRACQVVVAPQRLSGAIGHWAQAKAALRRYVEAGGGLLVTHDAVGMRQHAPLFPELCVGGSDRAELSGAIVAAEHAISAGLQVGAAFEHSYPDHIPVVVRGSMTVVVKDAEGHAVVAAGALGKGRYVANGMCTGLGEGDREVAPAGAEGQLLVNAVKWLAGR